MRKLLISIDPGKINFAYSVMKKDGKILSAGLFDNTITDIKNGKELEKEIKSFRDEIKKLLSKYKSDKYILIFERFMPRGMHRANLSEIVNYSIATFLNESFSSHGHVKSVPITASSWKKYNKNRGIIIRNPQVVEHICDAIGMNFYYLVKNNYMDLERAKLLSNRFSNKNF